MKLTSALAERSKAKATPGVLVPAVKQHMLSVHMDGSDRRWDIVHPSELSHQKDFCPRAVYLRITEGPLPPEKFDYGLQNIFDEGHTIHAKWQERLRDATPLWGNWKCRNCDFVLYNQLEPDGCSQCHANVWTYAEITLDAEQEALLVGHADGGAWTTLAEIKSVGEGTVRIEEPEFYYACDGDLKVMWKDLTRPFKSHVNQADIYLWICNVRGYPFTSAEFIYESKWNQQVKNFTIQYNEVRSLKLVDQAKAIKYAVDHKEEPGCRFPGECENCKPFDARREIPKRRTARTTGRK